MAKFDPSTHAYVSKALHDFRDGQLYTSHGRKVRDHSQAIALGIAAAEEASRKESRRRK